MSTVSIDPTLEPLFEGSNIPESDRPAVSQMVLAGCAREEFDPSNLGPLSRVLAYQKPDGASMGTEGHLLAVLPGVGLLLFRPRGGLFGRKVDVQSMSFSSDAPGITFMPEENPHGRESYDLQGRLPDGRAVVRLGWSFDHGGRAGALRERERIARMLP